MLHIAKTPSWVTASDKSFAIESDIINKSGAWFSYNGERLAQGRDNAKQVLKENQELLSEIEAKVREKYNEAFVKSIGNEDALSEEDE